MIWFLCPFSREQQAQHVEDTWKRQDIDCNLLVVANGCEYKGNASHVINLKERRTVPALNAGLKYLRENDPDGIFARMDDDDIYFSGYLTQVKESLENADWSGISVVKIKLTDGTIIDSGSMSLNVGPGGTLAGKVSSALDFPDCFPVEDNKWCSEMDRKGYIFSRRISENYIRVRHSGCHSGMTDDQFRLFGVCP